MFGWVLFSFLLFAGRCGRVGLFSDFSEDLFGDFSHVHFEEDDGDDYG